MVINAKFSLDAEINHLKYRKENKKLTPFHVEKSSILLDKKLTH